jgi:hypothetical protein
MGNTFQNSILSEHNLSLVKHYLECTGFVAVLHWHLFGGRHPTPLAFHDTRISSSISRRRRDLEMQLTFGSSRMRQHLDLLEERFLTKMVQYT